jgi:hypothetical protein
MIAEESNSASPPKKVQKRVAGSFSSLVACAEKKTRKRTSSARTVPKSIFFLGKFSRIRIQKGLRAIALSCEVTEPRSLLLLL